MQFVFAGKAHPADQPGKEMIREIELFGRRSDVRGRFVFVPDYDMAIARTLYHGADVWLNNPRRPLEACGTSGMKAALNGALNCSILDGWWDEAYDGMNGWAIDSAEEEPDIARRDEREAASLFGLLEQEIVPLFYDRRDGIPVRWLERVKHGWATIGPVVHRVTDGAPVHDRPLRAGRCRRRSDAHGGWRRREGPGGLEATRGRPLERGRRDRRVRHRHAAEPDRSRSRIGSSGLALGAATATAPCRRPFGWARSRRPTSSCR